MSMQSVRDFLQKARHDGALRQQLEGLKAKDKDTTVAALVRIAATAGCRFTPQEYEAAIREELARQHAAGEISEAQLEAVAGGRESYLPTDCQCPTSG